jgi:exodeoxyribonuclease V gamma subunit
VGGGGPGRPGATKAARRRAKRRPVRPNGGAASAIIAGAAPMLHLYFANRLESLRGRLLAEVRAGAPTVFEPVQLLVPSLALRRWLMLAFAQAEGVAANLRFEFLAQWLYAQPRRSGAALPARTPLAPDTQAWRVFAALDDEAFVAAHPRLKAWLERADPAMRLELAQRSARLLEQYSVYRPEWLPRWAAGAWAEGPRPLSDDEAWQAALWRRVDAAAPLADPAAVLRSLLTQHPQAMPALPAAVHVFALPTMPPLHFDLLRGWAQRCEVHVYALNPCADFWYDGAVSRRAGRREKAAEDTHPLLTAWGQQQRQQLERLVSAIGEDGILDDDEYLPAESPRLLARLQDSLLEGRAPAAGDWPLDEGDRSIELHVCHSLVRQVEVLHDRLLGLFAADPALRADEVLVVVPDLEAAAPLVEAVFGSAPPARSLPFEITGRAGSQASSVARSFVALLALAASRWPVDEVFALMQQPPVARRFGLDADTLDLLRSALAEAGVRWGRDAAHRAAFELPASHPNTFDDGLERLLLGHLLPDEPLLEAGPFAGLLPAAGLEGSAASALGALAAFVQALAALRDATAAPLPAEAWRERLSQALDAFFAPEGDERDEATALRGAVGDTCNALAAADGALPVPLPALQAALVARLDDPAHGGVPGGAVTVSSLASLRGLPYAWVCVLGLDDGVFPSNAQPEEFDLIARSPRAGDRQRSHDDRALFLDLVLAARTGLHLSTTGRSERDNAALSPSTLAIELLDFVQAATGAPRSRFVVEQPLQPFAARAFAADGDPRLRSHHAELAAALQAAQAARGGAAVAAAHAATAAVADDESLDEEDPAAAARFEPPPPRFFAAPLPPPPQAERTIDSAQLARFLAHPARELLRSRLGLAWARDEAELDATEPLLPAWHEQRAVASRVLPLLHAAPGIDPLHFARAGNDWPAGDFGEPALRALVGDLQAFTAALPRDEPLPPVTLSLTETVDGLPWTLAATLPDVRPAGLVRWEWDRLDGRGLLAAWIDHLVLCAAVAQGRAAAEPRTVLHRRDGRWHLRPVEGPASHLGALLRLYAEGQCAPLALPLRSTWALAQQRRAGGSPLAQIGAARKVWHGEPWRHRAGEREDAAWRIALRGQPDPLDDGFAGRALALFEPVLAHLHLGLDP